MNSTSIVLAITMFYMYCTVDVYIVYLYIYEAYFFPDGREAISHSSAIWLEQCQTVLDVKGGWSL